MTNVAPVTHAPPPPGPATAVEVEAALVRQLPTFAAGTDAQRTGWLAAALSMVSYSQRESAGHVMPLVSVQATLWVPARPQVERSPADATLLQVPIRAGIKLTAHQLTPLTKALEPTGLADQTQGDEELSRLVGGVRGAVLCGLP